MEKRQKQIGTDRKDSESAFEETDTIISKHFIGKLYMKKLFFNIYIVYIIGQYEVPIDQLKQPPLEWQIRTCTS